MEVNTRFKLYFTDAETGIIRSTFLHLEVTEKKVQMSGVRFYGNRIIKLARSTGAFDINENEIFEGDEMQHTQPFSVRLTVNWDEDTCGFVLGDGSTSYSVNSNGLYIVGNIYQP